MSKANQRSQARPSPFDNRSSRSYTRRQHTPTTGFASLPKLTDGKVEKLLHGVELRNQSKSGYTTQSTTPGAVDARKLLADALVKFELSREPKPNPEGLVP